MKIDVGAESPAERLALTLRLVPTPVFHTLVPMLAARALLVGTKLGVFEALGRDPLTAADVAAKLGTEPTATEKLLNALAGLGYLRAAGEWVCALRRGPAVAGLRQPAVTARLHPRAGDRRVAVA